MNSNDPPVAILLLMFGMMLGLLLAFILVRLDNGAWVTKEKLTIKKTIQMENCYAQYSAVRRFPK